MKTPREILFERHQATEAKLDAVREEVLAKLAAERKAGGRTGKLSFKPAVRQWLWPSPWAWAGAGAAWMLIFAFDFSASQSPEQVVAVPAQALPASVVKMASAERLVLMNSLLDLTQAEPAVPPRPPVSSRPHSERKTQWCCA